MPVLQKPHKYFLETAKDPNKTVNKKVRRRRGSPPSLWALVLTTNALGGARTIIVKRIVLSSPEIGREANLEKQSNRETRSGQSPTGRNRKNRK